MPLLMMTYINFFFHEEKNVKISSVASKSEKRYEILEELEHSACFLFLSARLCLKHFADISKQDIEMFWGLWRLLISICSHKSYNIKVTFCTKLVYDLQELLLLFALHCCYIQLISPALRISSEDTTNVCLFPHLPPNRLFCILFIK